MTLQHIEAQKAARYVGNYSEKAVLTSCTDNVKGVQGEDH